MRERWLYLGAGIGSTGLLMGLAFLPVVWSAYQVGDPPAPNASVLAVAPYLLAGLLFPVSSVLFARVWRRLAVRGLKLSFGPQLLLSTLVGLAATGLLLIGLICFVLAAEDESPAWTAIIATLGGLHVLGAACCTFVIAALNRIPARSGSTAEQRPDHHR